MKSIFILLIFNLATTACGHLSPTTLKKNNIIPQPYFSKNSAKREIASIKANTWILNRYYCEGEPKVEFKSLSAGSTINFNKSTMTTSGTTSYPYTQCFLSQKIQYEKAPKSSKTTKLISVINSFEIGLFDSYKEINSQQIDQVCLNVNGELKHVQSQPNQNLFKSQLFIKSAGKQDRIYLYYPNMCGDKATIYIYVKHK